MQLLVKPFVQAHRANGIDVAGPGAESEAIKGMNDTLVALDLGGLELWAVLYSERVAWL